MSRAHLRAAAACPPGRTGSQSSISAGTSMGTCSPPLRNRLETTTADGRARSEDAMERTCAGTAIVWFCSRRTQARAGTAELTLGQWLLAIAHAGAPGRERSSIAANQKLKGRRLRPPSPADGQRHLQACWSAATAPPCAGRSPAAASLCASGKTRQRSRQCTHEWEATICVHPSGRGGHGPLLSESSTV